jgi:hypothetical protein
MESQSYDGRALLSNARTGVYTVPVMTLACAILMSILSTVGGFAAGADERSAPPTLAEVRLRAFVLVDGQGDGQKMFTEKMSLPEALSLSDWTEFSFQGSEVKLESLTRMSLRSRKMIAESAAAGVLVQEYELAALLPRQSGPKGRRFDVSFTARECLNSKGKVLFQPVRLAVMRAITQSGRRAGEARLVEISSPSPGRFAALVELR